MSKYIDADLYVEMQIYDDEHEDWKWWKGTIEDLLDEWTEEGCPPTIEASEEQSSKLKVCDYYYKGYCSKYDDGCFHQCKQNQVSEDAISRANAIKAVKDVSENYTKEGDREWHPHIDFIVDALVQVAPSVVPTTEKSSMVEEQVCSKCGMACSYEDGCEDWEPCKHAPSVAPSVIPQPKEGEWKWESEIVCEKCGYEIPHIEKVMGGIVLMDSKDWSYCPNCGSRRGEEQMMSDDVIRRSDAIKATWQEPTYTDPLNVLTEVRDRIEAIPSADRPQEWIPCSERFPKEEGIYLVTATNYIFDTDEIVVGTCYFNIEYGFTNNRKILAWMPLPKPWKGADDEKL